MIYINEEKLKQLSIADLVAIKSFSEHRLSKTDPSSDDWEYFFVAKTKAFETLNDRMSEVFNKSPFHKIQYKSRHEPTWKECTPEHFEQIKHLARFSFRKIDQDGSITELQPE